MSPWNPRANDLFLNALDISDAAARQQFLEEACGADGPLREQVDVLLTASERAGSFLERPAMPPNDPGTISHDQISAVGETNESVGTLLAGRYKLVEVIGDGGMGSVYMAQQTKPVKRAVAVKVIKAGMDTKAVLARFEAERQALALMDHPNIAKVLDAGTTDSGRPFFVMELVKGVPITKFCDARRLTTRQRLELFIPVCQAIQHAHQKGVIHRDIKPSNVLVALYDDKPVPKVIDFGVAKATGQQLTDKTMMTGFGAVVGTPEYMSPEQASLNNLDVDTRSDVYALGVLLYELLTGSTPVDRKSLGKAALLEILRIVREVEAPLLSAKLSTIDTLPSVAANRGTEPAKLSKLMKGDLDWIAMKSLEKDRSRRYDNVTSLAKDVERFLKDEPIEARPPSLRYRLQKFLRRNKRTVIVTTVVFASVCFGIIGLFNSYFQAAVQNRNSQVSARWHMELDMMQWFLQEDICRPNSRNPNRPFREVLDDASDKISARFKSYSSAEARVRDIFGEAYMNMVEHGKAERQMVMAVELDRNNKDYSWYSEEPLFRMSTLARLYSKQKRFDKEEALHVEIVNRYRVIASYSWTDLDQHNRVHAMLALAECYMDQGKLRSAEPFFSEVIQMYNNPTKYPMNFLEETRFTTRVRHAKCLIGRNALAEAERELRECVNLTDEEVPYLSMWDGGEPGSIRANANILLAEALIGQKKYAEAEPVLLKVYEGRKAHEEKTPPLPGTVNPRIVKALDHLITLYTATNKPDDVKKWQAERAKYPDNAPKPGEKK